MSMGGELVGKRFFCRLRSKSPSCKATKCY